MLVLAACGTPATHVPDTKTDLFPITFTLMLPTRIIGNSTSTVAPSSTTTTSSPTPTAEAMHMDNNDTSDTEMVMNTSVSGDPNTGKVLFEKGNGNPAVPACISCHNADSEEVKVGPSLAEIGHHGIEHAKEYGQTVEAFLRESIVDPNQRFMEDPTHVFVVNGVSLMYQNYGKDMSEQEITDIIAYLLTLK